MNVLMTEKGSNVFRTRGFVLISCVFQIFDSSFQSYTVNKARKNKTLRHFHLFCERFTVVSYKRTQLLNDIVSNISVSIFCQDNARRTHQSPRSVSNVFQIFDFPFQLYTVSKAWKNKTLSHFH